MDAAQVAAIVAATRLAEPVVKTGLKLFESLFGESCRVFGDLLADQIYSWQWHNRIQILDRAAKQLEGKTIDPTTMPAGFLIPLLDACGNAEDEILQEMWASLLVEAGDRRDAQSPMFIRILKDLSPDDARYLLGCGKNSVHPYLESRRVQLNSITESEVRLRTLGLLSGGHSTLKSRHMTKSTYLSEFGQLFLRSVTPRSSAK
ncbi:DUF4393 domain-containing protein [bacterium]|nr:DUF4393 domain-containing protein [bacterium]